MGGTSGSCWASVGRGGFECFLRVLFLVSGEPLLTPHLSLRGNAKTHRPHFPPTRKTTIRTTGGGREGGGLRWAQNVGGRGVKCMGNAYTNPS